MESSGLGNSKPSAPTVSRRHALKKAAVGVAVGGAVWNAPRIEGLSLRPNYAAAASAGTVYLARINAQGPTLTSLDSGPDWVSDAFLSDAGSTGSASFPAVEPGGTVPGYVPGAIFDTERWSSSGFSYAVPAPVGALVTVRLFLGNGWPGANDPGERVYDILIDGVTVQSGLDLIVTFGHEVGGMLEYSLVSDGLVDISFMNVVQNPLVNGIEVVCT